MAVGMGFGGLKSFPSSNGGLGLGLGFPVGDAMGGGSEGGRERRWQWSRSELVKGGRSGGAWKGKSRWRWCLTFRVCPRYCPFKATTGLQFFLGLNA